MSILLQVIKRVVHFVLRLRNNHFGSTDVDRPIALESESENGII